MIETSEPKTMEGLTEGRMVHFVMPNGAHRPAVIVCVQEHGQGIVNLQVFTDGLNDRREIYPVKSLLRSMKVLIRVSYGVPISLIAKQWNMTRGIGLNAPD